MIDYAPTPWSEEEKARAYYNLFLEICVHNFILDNKTRIHTVACDLSNGYSFGDTILKQHKKVFDKIAQIRGLTEENKSSFWYYIPQHLDIELRKQLKIS